LNQTILKWRLPLRAEEEKGMQKIPEKLTSGKETEAAGLGARRVLEESVRTG
jgi:hypothetical protein